MSAINSRSAYMAYWGKADRADPDRYHPLALHGLDAAALAWALLESDPLPRRGLGALSSLPAQALPPLAAFLAGLHDAGKFSPRFQALRPDLFQRLQGRRCSQYPLRHTALGQAALAEVVRSAWLERGWFGLDQAAANDWGRRKFLDAWLAAAAGHHGQPLAPDALDDLPATSAFPKTDWTALGDYAGDLAALLGADQPWLAGWNLSDHLPGVLRASWLLAGLIVLCDWLASNERYFPYLSRPVSLAEYWPETLARARRVLGMTGLLPARPAPFAGLQGLFDHLSQPRPMQVFAAEEVELNPGPALFILEDSTGSGKTEAALALAQRLLAQGEADGLFMALPTMATANAMYRRLQAVQPRFFAPGEKPSLVLAHSQKRLVNALALAGDDAKRAPVSSGRDPNGGEEDSGVESAVWLADSNKKALLANLGVGTLDQALLAALPVRHQALRLLGLGRSLLIADEVHAYDAYTTELLAGLLRFQAALGGSAVLLSATLPLNTRRQLTKAFAAGLGLQGEIDQPASLAYPLATCLQAGRVAETPVDLAPGLSRELRVSLVHDEAAIRERLAQAARAGGCACWIRNTVGDAMRAYRDLLAEPGLGPGRVELFHARFAMGDRLAIEDRVLDAFGPHSRPSHRAGRVLVATQVVEQSLDLDFDLLASDLAPMDLIIQRAGRLHRHHRPHRPLAEPELLVLSPPPTPDAPRDWFRSFLEKASFVYPRHGQLWLTASLLAAAPRLRLPERARELVEGVYGDEAAERVPKALQAIEEKREGDQSAERSLGQLHCLAPDQGYALGGSPWGEDTPTRLGHDSAILRLARWENNELRPWADGEGMLAWELSQVRVRRGLVAGENPSPGPALAAALAQAKENMADQCRYALLIALEPGPDGAWRGRAVNHRQEGVEISYHNATGVDIMPLLR
ncbi:MAG: CRISPR-associated helicase Cas3' [Thermodesulfobacteriota bacterium]